MTWWGIVDDVRCVIGVSIYILSREFYVHIFVKEIRNNGKLCILNHAQRSSPLSLGPTLSINFKSFSFNLHYKSIEYTSFIPSHSLNRSAKKKSIPWLHFMANYPPRTQKSIEILTKPNSFLSLQPSSDWLCKTDRHAHRTACTLYIYILSELADLITTTPSPVYNRNIFVGCVETHSLLIEVHRRHTVCLRPPTVT